LLQSDTLGNIPLSLPNPVLKDIGNALKNKLVSGANLAYAPFNISYTLAVPSETEIPQAVDDIAQALLAIADSDNTFPRTLADTAVDDIIKACTAFPDALGDIPYALPDIAYPLRTAPASIKTIVKHTFTPLHYLASVQFSI